MHLAQVALLMRDMEAGADIVCADPSLPQSHPRQAATRGDVIAAWLWRRFLPHLPQGVDQFGVPFAAFRADLAQLLAPRLRARRTPLFVWELLLRAALLRGGDHVARVPVTRRVPLQGEVLDHPVLLAQMAALAPLIARDFTAAADTVHAGGMVEWMELCSQLTPSKWQHVCECAAADAVAPPVRAPPCDDEGKEATGDRNTTGGLPVPTVADFRTGGLWAAEDRLRAEEEERERLAEEEAVKEAEERAKRERAQRRRSKR